MLDRSLAPPVKTIDTIQLLLIQEIEFSNKFKVYYLQSPESGIIQLSFLFKAGYKYQYKKTLADTLTSLLVNGSVHHSAKELSEMLEQYGVLYTMEPMSVYSKCQFTFLRKNMSCVLPVIEEIIKYANFPQDELDIYIQTNTEQYQTLIKNVATVAQWQYSRIIYGEEHPLNKWHTPEDYQKLTRNDLLHYFTTHFHPHNGFIFISGNIDEEVLKLLDNAFGKKLFHQTAHIFEETVPLPNSLEKHVYIQLPDALQSAIRVGMPIDIHFHHDHYFDFVIANALLGGFGGSRLMRVIREEKGYTYGIYSTLTAYDSYSVFTVSAEVKAEYTQASIDEILYQIKLLQNTPPDEEELRMVKNYLAGELLDHTDGILKQDNVWKSLIMRRLDANHYHHFLHRIKTIQPEDISAVMRKYISIDQLKRCIVGKLN